MARIKYKELAKLEVKRGKPAIGKKPGKAELRKLYIKESRSIREVAETFGCSKDMVFRSLKEYGIKTREHVKKSKLWQYSIEKLEREIKTKGVRGFARELGINESTLRYHIKKARKKK